MRRLPNDSRRSRRSGTAATSVESSGGLVAILLDTSVQRGLARVQFECVGFDSPWDRFATTLMLLNENNIKAELSYAYLHAVAARAACSASEGDRHSDGAGVDAIIRAKERFAADSILTHFTIEVQLKATSEEPPIDDRGRYSFSLLLDHYNKLRDTETQAQLILVVLFLPPDPELWLNHADDCLISRRCAYWVSLRGAPESRNKTRQTILVPRRNHFSSEGLRSVMARVSRGEKINYEL